MVLMSPGRTRAPGRREDLHAVVTRKEKQMESSTRDKVEGALHQVKGKVKEVAGIVSDNPDLEAEGTGEKIAGKVQVKIGQFNKFFGK